MANYKRRKCRYLGSNWHRSTTTWRARLGLKPILVHRDDFTDEEWRAIDWGDKDRGKKYNWGYPHAWDIRQHTRPRRAGEKRLEKKLLHGADSENLNWPLEKKPHKYYW